MAPLALRDAITPPMQQSAIIRISLNDNDAREVTIARAIALNVNRKIAIKIMDK